MREAIVHALKKQVEEQQKLMDASVEKHSILSLQQEAQISTLQRAKTHVEQ